MSKGQSNMNLISPDSRHLPPPVVITIELRQMAEDDILSLLDYDEDDEMFKEPPQQQQSLELAGFWAENGVPQQQQQQQQPQIDDDDGELDSTIPAVELSKEEKKRLKNQKKGKKRREKKQERLVCNAIAMAEGRRSRRDIAEEEMKRRIEGMVSRERGRLRQEASQEIELRLARWRADVESGRINIERGISKKGF